MGKNWAVICGGALAIAACQQGQANDYDYFGETPPGDTPKVFAPGTISLPGRWEGNAVFSVDGRDFFFNVTVDDHSSIYHAAFDGTRWSEPKPFEAIGDDANWEPFITRDGKTFYFVSARPPGTSQMNGRIWKSRKEDNAWRAPEFVDLEAETDSGFWFPNVSNAGDLYFSGVYAAAGNVGRSDGYVLDAQTQTVSNIEAINTEHHEWDPYTAPDGSFLMWASNRPGGYGETDLYISFKTADGAWGEPMNMGDQINTAAYEVAPRLSPDGKYLFFDRPIDGTQDIYWISMEQVLSLNE